MSRTNTGAAVPPGAAPEPYRPMRRPGHTGWPRLRTLDPRLLQLAGQGSLLLVGALWLDFALTWPQVVLTFAVAVASQHLWLRARGLQGQGQLSALVTAFGLSLLVRADNLWVHPLLAVLAISSKFVWRYPFRPGEPGAGSAHRFNPANLGAMLALTVLPGAWLSPGQWGQATPLAVLVVALGMAVSLRAARADASWTFLGCFALLVTARVLWLGANPWVIWHQLHNGALLLFAFFMISDPMTTPRLRWHRMAFAAAVALLAFVWQALLYQPHGPVVALFLASFAVPWLNRRAARQRQPLHYAWTPANSAAGCHPGAPVPR